MRTIIIIAICLMFASCAAKPKLKITDKNGNSLTLAGDSVDVDVKKLERDGMTVEVMGSGDIK